MCTHNFIVAGADNLLRSDTGGEGGHGAAAGRRVGDVGGGVAALGIALRGVLAAGLVATVLAARGGGGVHFRVRRVFPAERDQNFEHRSLCRPPDGS
jgi:hypothetical protein